MRKLDHMGDGKTRWGFLATGDIAGQMAVALRDVDRAVPYAVASRDIAKARAFAENLGFEAAYGAYEDLLADPAVEIVYIATPNTLHKGNILDSLRAGKHVVVEKPMCLTAVDAEACILEARKLGLFLMEAMWCRYLPIHRKALQLLGNGEIGDVVMGEAAFVSHRAYDPSHRLFNPELGGGSLHDLGVYPISFLISALGIPTDVAGHILTAPTGVDMQATVGLRFGNGALAEARSGFLVEAPATASFTGSKGTIRITPPFFRPSQLDIHLNGGEVRTIIDPVVGNGYAYELRTAQESVRRGLLEPEERPNTEAVAVLKVIETMLAGTVTA